MTGTEGVGKKEMCDEHVFDVAFFVTSHGFGHASRACAVASALLTVRPETRFAFYTEVPSWFFEDNLCDACILRSCCTDVGLVQDTPFQHDVGKTLDALSDFFPFNEAKVGQLAEELNHAGCRLVVCDVSALGIEAAHTCGVPAVLLENFTWDWVYEDFLDRESRFEPFVQGLRETYLKADYHLQTEPFCLPAKGAHLIPPISRAPRRLASETRAELGVPEDVALGLLTTGGIRGEMTCLNRLQEIGKTWFLAPGACSEGIKQQGNLVCLSHRSGFHHPDLVAASDFLVGKAGFGTISEALVSGVSFAYVLRENFRESPHLREFLRREGMGFEISEAEFQAASWLERLDELLALSERLEPKESGAMMAALALAEWF